MRKLLTLVLLFSFYAVLAQTGEVDQTFNPDDIGWYMGRSFSGGDVKGIVELPGGDLIAVGNFTEYQYYSASRIVRIDGNGNYSSLLTVSEFTSSNINDIQLQPDGKILLCGSITYNSVAQNIIRIDEFGHVDPTFQPVSGANNVVQKMNVLDDGRIFISGTFTQYDGQQQNKLAILHEDGTLDATFNPGTATNAYVGSLEHLPDGTLLAGGQFTLYNGNAVSRFVALNQDGTISSTYPSQVFSGEVKDILALPDGSIEVCGSFFNFSGNTSLNRLVKIDANGAVVPDFIVPAFSLSTPTHLALDSNGKLVVAGDFSLFTEDYRGVIRLNEDGSLDNTFSYSFSFTGEVTGLIAHANGTITVAGPISEYNGWLRDDLFRLDPDGNVSNEFRRQYGPSSSVERIEELPDGKILVGGAFSGYNGIVTGSLIRLLPDGSLDETFQLADFDGSITDFEVQPDGKIIIIGTFQWIEGELTGYIARLEADGAWDETFNVDGGFGSPPKDILLLQTGRVLVAGGFSEYSDQPCSKIVRLNADGSKDPNFAVGLYIGGGSILCLALDAGGNIICGGDFSAVENDNSYGLCKLFSNGNYASSFQSSLTFFMHDVNDVAIDLESGHIYVCGFIDANDNQSAYVLRMNSDGSIDETYHSDVYSYIPNELLLTDNKKLFVAGTFNSQIGAMETKGLVRLLEDGSYDPSFDIGFGLENAGNTLEVLANGDIMVGGFFQWIDSVGVSNLARLKSCDIPVFVSDTAFVACDVFELPVPVGYNLTSAVNYFNDSAENNGALLPSLTMSESQTVWLRDGNACGQSELPIEVTIHISPVITPLPDTIVGCFIYTLPEITGEYLTENIGYYATSHTTNPNQFEMSNLNITATGDYFIYDYNGDCVTEVEFYVEMVPNFNITAGYTNFQLSTLTVGDSYQWVVCGDPVTPIEGATNNSYQPTEIGYYAVVVTRNGCDKMSSCIEVPTVSVGEYNSSRIAMYPNPAHDRIHLVLTDQTDFYLYDMIGQLVRNETLKGGNQEVDLQGLSAGNYMLKLRTEYGQVVKKLMIE